MDPRDDYEDFGNQGVGLEDNDEVGLFRSLEHELESLVQRYRVPPDELRQLFEVVQRMFDMMDDNREAYEKMEAEKNELDELWKKEKDNLRKTQMRKLELESQLEEEKMKIEHEKMNIEKEKVVLETKVKHIGEQKHSIEQELQQLKEKANRDEQTRQELLEQYKRQTENVRSASLQRRMQSPLPRRRALPIAPERKKPLAHSLNVHAPAGRYLLDASVRSENFMIGSMEVPRDDAMRRRIKQDEIEVKEAEKQKRKNSQGREMSPPCVLSLDDEFKQLEGPGGEEEGERVVNEETLLEDLIEEVSEGDRSSESGEESTTEAEEKEEDDDENENWRNIEEELKLQEDMMAVKMEVEMMQKEKEGWEKERKNLEQDKIEARSQREALEQQNAELRVELRRLKETHDGMKQRIEDVTKERDEIFDNYLEQPFSEYCITRKELHDLLMRQQTTALQLEEEKEQRIKLQRLLDSKRSFLERFRERMKKIFVREHRTQTTPAKTPKEVELAPRPAAPYPSVPAPLYRSLALLLDQGYLVVDKGWLMSTQSNLNTEQLPHWMGQITLKGVVTDRIECVELGRIYYSPLELYSSQVTPPMQRKARSHHKKERMILTGLHAEVWVTTKEESVACVEVIDVLARPPKVRQRFTLKPKTPHIVCMRSIPGIIEQSKDFVNSSIFSQKTDWVSASLFPTSSSSSETPVHHRRLSDGSRRPRPKSASFAGRGGAADLMLASTPDLSQSGYSDPICVDQDLFTSTMSESPLTPARNRKSLKRTGSDSPTTMLKTINEIPTSDVGGLPLDEQFELLEEVDALKSEDGSSSSLRSGESGIDMADGFFSFGKKQHGASNSSGSSNSKRSGLQNGNRSPGMGTEHQKTSTPRDSKSQSKLDFNQSPSPSKDGRDSLTRSAEWMHFSEPVGMHATSKLRTRLPDYSKDSIPEVSVTNEDSNDGRTERKYTDGRTPIMWMITEDNTLYFYPTTDPSHRPINSVKLRSRATCMEYIGGKVFVGHVGSSISVYHKDEFSPSWDIENPEVVNLPSFNPEVQNDVRCIAAVKDRVWVGAGPSIFFLCAESLQREGSRFLNSWHYPPDQILPLGDVVAVSTKSSALFIFDADSADILRKFDVYPITKQIDIAEENSKWRESKSPSKWKDRSVIKTMVADESMLYVGTSRGMVIAIPIDSLKKKDLADALPVTNGHASSHMTNGFDETDEGREAALKRELKLSTAKEDDTDVLRSSSSSGLLDEPEEVYLDNCALALHVQKDSRVRSLLHLKLPIKPPSKLSSPSHSSDTGALYHSLPNLNSSFGSRTTISPPIMSYRSLVISAGKGHMEYSEDPEPEDTGVLPTNYNALRERNEAYQLLVWGHRNAAKYQYY